MILTRDELLGMVQLLVCSGSDFVDDGGLEIDEESAGNVLSRPGLAEERVK